MLRIVTKYFMKCPTSLCEAIVVAGAIAIVVAAGSEVEPTAKGHDRKVRAYTKPQEGHRRANQRNTRLRRILRKRV